jgi:MYXO-CTERM domain-containing protein
MRALTLRTLAVTIGAIVGCSLSLARDAHANGRMPAGHQLVVSPSDPTFFVMETTLGLFVSHDRAKTFGWVCEDFIGYGEGGKQEDAVIAMTSTALIAGLPEGLAISSDQACSWTRVSQQPIIDLVVSPTDPHTAMALASTMTGVGDAGENLYATTILVTHNDGAMWAPLATPVPAGVQVETIELAASDPNRIYIGGAGRRVDADGGIERVAIVLASKDGGSHYSQTTSPLVPPYEPARGAAFVSAVDPANADRVYVRLGDGVVDRLLVSDDGAGSFRTAYQGVGPLTAFALTTDGSTVFVGGTGGDGLQVAHAYASDAGPGLTFSRGYKDNYSCLRWTGGLLYGCMGEPKNSFLQEVATSSDYGSCFTPIFDFSCLSGPLACPGGSIVDVCAPVLAINTTNIGTCDDGGMPVTDLDASCGVDAGVPNDSGNSTEGGASSDSGISGSDGASPGDGGMDAGPGGHASSGSCGCEAGEAAGAGGLSAVAMLALAALRRRRRR